MAAQSNPGNIFSLLQTMASISPERVAIEASGRYPITYSGLLRLVKQVILMLRLARLSRSDRVAVVMPNGPEHAVVLLGVSSIAVCVPVNPDLTKPEFVRQFGESKIKLLVHAGDGEHPAAQAAVELGIPVMGIPVSPNPSSESRVGIHRWRAFSTTATNAESYVAPEAGAFDEEGFMAGWPGDPEPEDVAVLMRTTGTTSAAKRVPLTHANLLHGALNIARSLGLDDTDCGLSMMPQFHIGGLVDTLLAPICSGGRVVFAEGFDAKRFYRCLREFQPTWYQAVPTTLAALLKHARSLEDPSVAPPLRLIRSVSSPLPRALQGEIENEFGVPVIEIYGMTEAGPLITSNPVPPGVRKRGSVGVPVGTEVRIVDEHGLDVPGGGEGEIVIRGPGVFSGYESDGVDGSGDFVDGWFRTGDLGFFDDDDYLFLTGRKKELINRGGEKISPFEIDAVLLQHPAVSEALTFPAPHRTLGETVAALVVPAAGARVDESAILAHLRQRLSRFKIPQRIYFADNIPTGATGKARRLAVAGLLGITPTENHVAPRTANERRIAEIWQESLDIDTLGIRDNFFELGGNSIVGLELVERVGAALGLELPEKAIFEISTVENMAREVEAAGREPGPGHRSVGTAGSELLGKAARAIKIAANTSNIPRVRSDSVLLCANPDGIRPPLYWCFNHPDNEMQVLANALGRAQPVIGFYSGSGLYDDSRKMISVTSRFYADVIAEHAGGSPIMLAGNCRGAAVALGIAGALLANGRDDVSLLLMEYFDPDCFEYPGEFTLLYGRQSAVRGYERFHYGRIGWRERFVRVPEVKLIDGYHGSFWAQPFLAGFASAVSEFIGASVGEVAQDPGRMAMHAGISGTGK